MIYKYVYLCVGVYLCPKRALDPLEMVLQAGELLDMVLGNQI